MEILENLENEIRALSAKIDQVSEKVEQPPVVKIDTAKLATAVTHNLSDYTAAGEKVTRRIEAAAASIPREIKNQYGIDPPTQTLVIAVLLVTLTAGLAGSQPHGWTSSGSTARRKRSSGTSTRWSTFAARTQKRRPTTMPSSVNRRPPLRGRGLT